MVKLCNETLIEILDCFRTGGSYQDAADAAGGASRRMIYHWLDKSRAGHPLFHITYQDRLEWWHEHVARLRLEAEYTTDNDLVDCSLDECYALTGFRDRWKRDDAGNIVRHERIAEQEAEPPRGDIDDLRAQADVWAKKPKTAADSPVQIGRVTINPNDPVEQIGGERPPEMTTAERERAHPRAYQSPNADLRPAAPPSWAKPSKIEGAGFGHQQPSQTMRADAVPQHRLRLSERIHHGPLALRDAKGNAIG